MLDHQKISDDYSQNFAAFRTKLVGTSGERYVVFVRRLKPRFWVVYRDIAAGYSALALTLVLAVLAPAWGVPKLLTSTIAAFSIGFWIAYLQLFIHEGAHYNLAPEKSRSDHICDWAISWMIGTTVEAYRAVHFQHHRDLGKTTDTEFTYFFPLNLLFALRASFGIRAFEVLLARRSNADRSVPAARNRRAFLWLAGGAAIHGIIVAGTFLLGWWWVSVAWIIGVAMFFPLFGALRQLLEHRNDEFDAATDFRSEEHGPYTRLFRDGPVSATFGGAGFSRHLLHHWEPQVSYTNLAELESFLEGTEVRHIMAARRTTYLTTFRKLWT
ncbi:fatty acid desaturase [Variibacter gotjawalensis]|uniref:Fatty acid desaturase n=1 Tax=Variibacter gotjawalensis TaxID=1333996 RepID=A0A0S3PX22_9BRAD|nr:fatty acid desaturase [Variibacter gotjawalensis]NIK46322.1 fatty acid desaturase [Variibacter gotjawalensis]RZS48232.1 fatty acid desaturase [Variibacter gotjawalensis]BAT60492.1 fatty acid desaturase [Variibacter gotjawalensis]